MEVELQGIAGKNDSSNEAPRQQNRIRSRTLTSLHLKNNWQEFNRDTKVVPDNFAIYKVGERDKSSFAWTLIDDLRLRNFQIFYQQKKEVDSFDKRDDFEIVKPSICNKFYEMNSELCDYVLFRKSAKKVTSGVYQVNRVYRAGAKEVQGTIDQMAKDPDIRFIWIDLNDVDMLPMLQQRFNLHPLIIRGFLDNRPEASTISYNGASLISILYLHFTVKAKPIFLKQFLCIADNFVVTFLIKLDLEGKQSLDEQFHHVRPSSSIGGRTDFADDSGRFKSSIIDKILKSDDGDEDGLAAICSPISSLVDRLPSIYQHCINVGPFYLLYELWGEIVKFQNGVMECISRSMRYFKSKLGDGVMNHRVKLKLVNNINTVKILLEMVARHAEFNLKALVKLYPDDTKNGSTYDSFDERGTYLNNISNSSSSNSSSSNSSSNSISNSNSNSNNNSDSNSTHDQSAKKEVNITDDYVMINKHDVEGQSPTQTATIINNSTSNNNESQRVSYKTFEYDYSPHNYTLYLNELVESFDYVYFNYKLAIEQLSTITASITILDDLRANQQSLFLSVVTTIFWPLCTMTAVYGTNFNIPQHLTMEALRLSYGPYILYGLLLFSFFICSSFFVRIGLIEKYLYIEYLVGKFYGKEAKFVFKNYKDSLGLFKALERATNLEVHKKKDFEHAGKVEKKRQKQTIERINSKKQFIQTQSMNRSKFFQIRHSSMSRGSSFFQSNESSF